MTDGWVNWRTVHTPGQVHPPAVKTPSLRDVSPYPPRVERVARAIAACHFGRKQHYGAGSVEARVAHSVENNWRTFVPDALAAIAAVD